MSKSRILLSRRGFVTGAAASLAVPTLIPRHVLGDENNAPANDKIVLGAVGIGKMMYGSHLPHFLKMPEVKIVAVCDVDTTRRETGKKRVDDAYGNTDCAMLTNHNDLVARDDVDAVVCATPDHWHAIVILDACKAGKDIYCEKPLTNNLVEAEALAQRAVKLTSADSAEGGAVRDTLAWIHYRNKKYDDANKYAQEAITAMPGSAEVRYHLGMILFERQLRASAARQLMLALKLAPEFEHKAVIEDVLDRIRRGLPSKQQAP